MYCWGNAQQGALGLGGIEELTVPTPKWNKYLAETNIKTVACGQDHTVILLDDRTVLTCGNNEFGQLGHEKGTMRPAEVDCEDRIVDIKCGLYHTVLLTCYGDVDVCGDNTYGQLSFIDNKYERIPRRIRVPNVNPDRKVVQVACGSHHTIVLLLDSRVYSWGRNNYGQLGHSKGQSLVPVPRQVKELESVPLNRITAGGAHNFAISITGNAYGWGRNSYGQLGINSKTLDYTVAATPFSLDGIKIKYIGCGEEHTVALVEDGRVFTCGSNHHGQLGRVTHEETSPVPSAVPMGSAVVQIACGKYHTLVLLKESGRLLSFGLNKSGQLGCTTSKPLIETTPPFVVEGEWLPHSVLEDFIHGSPVDRGSVVKRIFAGGNQSFASIYPPATIKEDEIPYPFNQGATYHAESPFFLDCDLLEQRLTIAVMLQTIGAIADELTMFFTSPSLINGSFLKRGDIPDDLLRMDVEQMKSSYILIIKRMGNYGTALEKQLNHDLFSVMLNAMPRPAPNTECLRAYCYLLCHPSMKEFPDCVRLLVPFIKVFLFIDDKEKEAISDWLFKGPMELILEWIEIFRKPIEEILKLRKKNAVESKTFRRLVVFLTDDETWALQEGIKVLKWLYYANMSKSEPIDFKKFYVDNVAEFCDLKEDYACLVKKKVDCVVFSRYHFVLNAAAKAEVLKADADMRKTNAQAQARANLIMNALLRGPPGPQIVPNPDFCGIIIRRENILSDAITSLLGHTQEDLKKPLLVKFSGEDGLDEGGMTKEFFMLLMKEILNPIYGLFYEEDESRLVWFREQHDDLAVADIQQYFLVGMVCGLAIYNGVNLDLPFPLVVYKKLLGGTGIHTPTLKDLGMLKPSVGKHLADMLELDDDTFEKKFPDLTFEITRVLYGSPVNIELIPNGKTVAVNRDNKSKYVQCYVDYELIEGTRKQFDAFYSGFKKVFNTECTIYQVLHPEELMSFIVGSNSYDFEELQTHTEYLNGYTKDHRSIVYFWEVVSEFPLDAKKKLLIFWTGSDRIPITGIKSMNLRIQRMDGGPQFARLPVAHTCANVLDLPSYPTHDLMRDKLLKAIHFTSGFGII